MYPSGPNGSMCVKSQTLGDSVRYRVRGYIKTGPGEKHVIDRVVESDTVSNAARAVTQEYDQKGKMLESDLTIEVSE